MAEKGFRLTVLTQEKAQMEQTVASVVAPGTEGYLGILRNHAPLVTGLMPGKLTVTDLDGHETVYAVSGGFLEVSGNVATILADAIEPPDQIDVDRAEASAERARERLRRREMDMDVDRAETAIKRAMNRLRVARSFGRG